MKAAMSQQNDNSTTKSALVLLLMSPVAVALVVGIYFALDDFAQALPILLCGVILGVLNIFVIRYMLAKLETDDPEG